MHKRIWWAAATALMIALSMPTLVFAAAQSDPPTIRATHAIDVEGSTALLLGSVNPRGLRTTWYFQLGTTKAYGLPLLRVSLEQPLEGDGGNGVEEAVECLAPRTTYHFRLIAKNRTGKTIGRDHVFRTRRLQSASAIYYNDCPGHKPLR